METPIEVAITVLAATVLWILGVIAILLIGQRKQSVRDFRDRMIAQWKPSLAIAVLFLIGWGLGDSSSFSLMQILPAIRVFCQSLVGLALARSVSGYEPLPVTQVIGQRERTWRSIGSMVVIALIVALASRVIRSVGLGIGRHIFGEIHRNAEAAGAFPSNIWLAFLLLLSGAGIGEETPYRLVILSLFWRLTRRRWLSIVLSAMIFGAYHLSPFDQMYRIFWQYPLSQFFASILGGVVLGYVYTKHGYETAVLSHTFGDWIPLLLFRAL